MNTHVALFRVVENHLVLVKRLGELFVHVCETEPFPKVCSTDLLISYISYSKQWVITHSLDLNETLFHDVFSFLSLSGVRRELLSHLFSSHTD